MLTVNEYCRRQFGKKLYKLSLDGGFTCPNRDGTLGTGGCIFCSRGGSGEFAEGGGDLDAQIERAKKRVEKKNKNGGYIAYFQSFTNTYAPAHVLRERFLPVITRPDIDVLSIATRPDCLPDETLRLLEELNRIKPVWVELGFQTAKPESVRFIRRGYENEVFRSAVRKLTSRGIYVISHMIIGLPGETVEDMRQTLTYMLESGVNGVKLQLLHVLTDSDLYGEWERGSFTTLTMQEYIDILALLLPLIPGNVAVHRLTGDGDKRTLAAPLWSADKKRVLNAVNAMLREKGFLKSLQ